MQEKVITPEQAAVLVEKLKNKYLSEIQDVNVRIQRDIDLFGFVTLETDKVQRDLSVKINNEKDNHEIVEN